MVLTADVGLLLAFAVLGEWARWQAGATAEALFITAIATVLLASCLYILLVAAEGPRIEQIRDWRQAGLRWTLAFAAASPLAYVMEGEVARVSMGLVSWYLFSIAGYLAWRLCVSRTLQAPRFQTRFAECIALIVYDEGDRAGDWLRRVEQATQGAARVVAVCGPGQRTNLPGVTTAESISDLVLHCNDLGIERILVAAPRTAGRELFDRLQPLRGCAVDVDVIANGYDPDITRWPAVSFAGIPAVRVVTRPLSDGQVFIKRAEDIVLASLAILFLGPVLVAIAAAVRLDSPGPIIFRQRRHGFNHACFTVWKFRTMYVDAASMTVAQATRDDPRVTPVGRVLRRTSLDELPQLFNVLLGEMSMIGPRPHAVEHNEFYGPLIENYMARHRMKPGITGWAQVHGWRGETESLDKMKTRIDHDIWYVDNWSLLLDVKIIFMTFSVLWHPNAY